MIERMLDLSGVTPLNRSQIEHLVYIAGKYSSRILFEHNNRTMNGKSVLGILSLGVTGHDLVKLEVEGSDEEEAAEEIMALLENGIAPPKDAGDAEELMQKIRGRYEEVLGENLIGIYLHGSLAANCFRWEHSDIDFLVVVRRPLGLETKIALVKVLWNLMSDAPPKGLEMSVILEKYCHPIPYPIPFELHYSPMHAAAYEQNAEAFCAAMHGEDPDITAHILDLHAFGRVICGPDIPGVFDPIRREDALSAIRYDMETLEKLEKLHEKPISYVLNLCRAVAYCRENIILSKKEGGKWALRHLSPDHQRVIQAALNAYETGMDMSYDKGQAEDFAFDAMEEIRRVQ